MVRLAFLLDIALSLSSCVKTEAEPKPTDAATPIASGADAGRKCSTVIDCANRALGAAEDAKQAASTALNPMKGAVVAFNLTNCPPGWAEYLPARGRFVRGIDNGNPSTDPDGRRQPGNLQDQLIADHEHNLKTMYTEANSGHGFFGQGITSNSDQAGGTKSETHKTEGVKSGAGTETRPKNVALLYCELK